MHSRASYLDRHHRVERPHTSLKRLQKAILVREHTKMARSDTQADSGADILGGGLEPCVALCGLEDMVQDGVVGVIIHCSCTAAASSG